MRWGYIGIYRALGLRDRGFSGYRDFGGFPVWGFGDSGDCRLASKDSVGA